MLKRIRSYFEQHLVLTGDESHREHSLHLAVGALLLEMAGMDGKTSSQECEAVVKSLGQCFTLADDEVAELMELAKAEHANSTDYFQFTSLINNHYTAAQKERLVEMLWHVAYSDRLLDMYEEHMVRRISELLYVPHKTFIAMKHKAAREAGLSTE